MILEEIEFETIEIVNDRKKCEDMHIDYCNPDMLELKNKLLRQYLKEGYNNGNNRN